MTATRFSPPLSQSLPSLWQWLVHGGGGAVVKK
jgi:hypothetical protein